MKHCQIQDRAQDKQLKQPRDQRKWNSLHCLFTSLLHLVEKCFHSCWSGAPNDGFLPNKLKTLFEAIQSPFRSLEVHSKRGYKICNCSVILNKGTWVFSKLQGLQYYFPENFRCNLTFYESENFSDSSLHHILESENFRFPFSKKNSVTWVVKYEKLNFRKS